MEFFCNDVTVILENEKTKSIPEDMPPNRHKNLLPA